MHKTIVVSLTVLLVLVIGMLQLAQLSDSLSNNLAGLMILKSYYGVLPRIPEPVLSGSTPSYSSIMVSIARGNYEIAEDELGNNRWSPERQQMIAYQLGFSLFRNGQIEKAARTWKMFLLDTSWLESILLTQGREAEDSQQVLAAERYYQAYALLNPVADHYELLGDFYLRHNLHAKAVEAFEQGKANASIPVRFYLDGRKAEAEGNWVVAVDSYRNAIASRIDGVAVYIRLAKVLAYDMGKLDDAIPFCLEATKISPGNYACYEILGVIYAAKGDGQRSIDWLDLGTRRVTGTYQNLYQSLFQQKAGSSLLEEGEYDRAEIYFMTAIRYNKFNAEAYYGLSLIYSARGDLSESVEALEQAVTVQIGQGQEVPCDWYNHLGELYERLSNVGAAFQAYEETLKLCPQDEYALKKIEILRNADK